MERTVSRSTIAAVVVLLVFLGSFGAAEEGEAVDDATARLLAQLDDDDESMRQAAFRELALMEGPTARARLQVRLEELREEWIERCKTIREEAIASLLKHRDVKRVEKLESLAQSEEGVDESYAIQAGREIRVIAKHDKLDDAQSALLASNLAKRIQQEMEYPGKIKVTVIRETRVVEEAK